MMDDVEQELKSFKKENPNWMKNSNESLFVASYNNLLASLTSADSVVVDKDKQEEKKFTVIFESLEEGGPTLKKLTLKRSTWLEWRNGFDIMFLKRPDGTEIYSFDGLCNGEIYRARCKSDSYRDRIEVDDQVLEIETGHVALMELLLYFPNAHIHSHLTLYNKKHDGPYRQYDSLIHGNKDVSQETVALLVETKTTPYPTDVEKVAIIAEELENFLQNGFSFEATSGTLRNQPIYFDFNHLSNVKRVIPCLAGKLFHEQNIKLCIKKGVIPIFPSGARYVVQGLRAVLKLTK